MNVKMIKTIINILKLCSIPHSTIEQKLQIRPPREMHYNIRGGGGEEL